MPSLSVVQVLAVAAQERRARRLLAAEAERPVDQPGHEPLEADRHLDHRLAQRRGDPVDHRGGHQRLADLRGLGPVGPRAAEEVADRDGEEVVGVHQPGVGRDDAVPVGVGVVAGGDVVVVLAPDQRGHRGRRGAVHPDLVVPVERHEPPGRVDQRVHHGQVEAGAGRRSRPSRRRSRRRAGRRRSARRPRGSGRGRARTAGRRRRCPGSRTPRRPAGPARTGIRRTSASPPRDQLVGPLGDHARRVGVGRTAVRRVVLEAAVGRRVVRGRDHDAVGQTRAGRQVLAAVGAEDRVRDRRASACSRRGRRPARSRRWRRAPPARWPRPARRDRGCRGR